MGKQKNTFVQHKLLLLFSDRHLIFAYLLDISRYRSFLASENVELVADDMHPEAWRGGSQGWTLQD